jgi:RNA polymerase sigma-70 factor (subfamily 1)
MNSTSVDTLLAEVRAGSREALGALLERYHPLLLRLAKSRIPTEIVCKLSPSDAVQEVSIDAMKSVNQLRAASEIEIKAWFCALLVHNIDDALRKFATSQKRDVRRERPLHADDSQNLAGILPSSIKEPLEQVLSREQRERFEVALGSLKLDYRSVIELRSRDGLSFKAIGLAQGKSPAAVRMIWNRAVVALTKELKNVL